MEELKLQWKIAAQIWAINVACSAFAILSGQEPIAFLLSYFLLSTAMCGFSVWRHTKVSGANK